MSAEEAGTFSSGCAAANRIKCSFNCPSCFCSSCRVQCVPRNASTLIAMSANVTTGQRRADIFSCLMGMSISPSPNEFVLGELGQCSAVHEPGLDGGGDATKVTSPSKSTTGGPPE